MLVANWIRRRMSRPAAVLGALALGLAFVVPATAALADGDGLSPGDTVSGTLTRVWTEHKDPRVAAQHGQDDLLTFVRMKDGDAVRLPTQQVQRVAEGASVSVTVGRQVVDPAAAEDGLDPARQVVSAKVIAPAPAATAPAPAAPGTAAGGTPVTDQVTVVMAVPLGASQDGTTLQQVVDQVNGPVASFWAAQSGGAIQLAVTAQYGWFQATVGCSDPYALWNQAAAVAGNWTRGPGKHLLVYLPGNAVSHGCAYGLGEVGYLGFGGLTYVTATQTSVIAHELGHNFGLSHSSEEQCDGAVESGTCRTTSYYDLYDVMGASWDQLGSLSVAQAAHLGFLPSTQRESFSVNDAAATVTLAPVSGSTGIRAIQMTAPDGTAYWLEYRPASGQDSWLDPAAPADTREGLAPGVLLRRWTTDGDSPGDGSLLLDATPSPQAGWSTDFLQPLTVGSPVGVAGGAFTVTVTAQGTNATVDIAPADPIAAEYTATGGATGPLGAGTAALACSSRICSEGFQHGAIYWSAGTGAHDVLDPLLSLWQGAGGATGSLGLPTADTACGLAGGGCGQDFQNAAFYWSPSSGAHRVSPAYLPAWGTSREQGPLGFPVTDLICGLSGGGCGQVFQGGRIYSTSATGTHAISGDIFTAWAAQGYEAGVLGYPTGDPVCGLASSGCKQPFQGGTIWWSSASGAHQVSGGAATAYAAAGGEGGALGYPTTGLICGLSSGGCGQVFQSGRIYWTPATGWHAIAGDLFTVWAGQGYEAGALGYPTTGLICGLANGGCGQVFQGGRIYSYSGSVHAISGSILAAWAAQGAESGGLGYPDGDQTCGLVGGWCKQQFLGGFAYASGGGTRIVAGTVASAFTAAGGESFFGYPTTGLICGLKSGGCGQVFQVGRIYTTAATGTQTLTSSFLDTWVAQGGEAGPLGYPTGGVTCTPGGSGCKQPFQGGAVYLYPGVAGAPMVSGAVATAYGATGADAGVLGFPITQLICGLKNGGCGQVFQNGRIYTTTSTGTHALVGPLADAWAAQGGEAGPLGYPTGDRVCGLTNGGCKQAFQGGTLFWSSATGAAAVSGPVGTAYAAAGAEAGALGYPTTGLICGLSGGGCGQVFQNGRIYSTSATGAHAISGPILTAWGAQGYEAGSLGYPTTDPYPVTGGTAEAFQGGTLTVDSGGQVTRT